jgi:DNA-binding MarR family transcriptional regulator
MNMSLPQELGLTILALKARYEKRLEQQFYLQGINLTEFLVLKALSEAPESMLRRVDLAQVVGLSASGITRVLAPMEKIGLVKKQENARDARVRLIKLSSAGLEILNNAMIGFDHACAQLAEPIEEADQQRVADLLKRML